ncbi:hypothetical protein EVAR_79782_1 [Eumeta japonica]|uniref:DDE-1 domain-containing protein n=1 Tax=Eumeta variegata TaxID=151549 RepID=A0A4C1SVF6_EUMVA|nr:hypothetical protein EVAR_79782_1 [Eumeta japonica]
MKAVKIQYLPANTTSKLRPMDQGIIKNFKSLYRKEVVRNMLDNMEEKKNSTRNLLHAMRMADKAWLKFNCDYYEKLLCTLWFSSSPTESRNENISPPADWYTVVSESGLSLRTLLVR